MSPDLPGHIAEMEPDLHHLLGLVRTFRIMGDRATNQDVDARAVYSVGCAAEEAAEKVLDAWREAFKLSHSRQEG